ncbi:MAG: SH3 domain-containing protein [Candidatus Rifleibacteriota bacterium]
MKKMVGFLLLLLVFSFTLPSNAQNQGDCWVISAPSGASLRDQPSLTGKKLGTIPFKAEVQLLMWADEENQSSVEGITGGWLKVIWQGREGYVFAGLVCSDRQEQKFIEMSDGKVKREMNRLTLTADNGKVLTLEDFPVMGEQSQTNRFMGQVAGQPFWLIAQVGWEWHKFCVVSTIDGDLTEIDEVPVFSPDSTRFVTMNCDIHAGFTPNRIQIYRVNSEGRVSYEWSVEPDAWGAEDPVWHSSVLIGFTRRSDTDALASATLKFEQTISSWILSDQ